jgi:UDP-N-acetylglucosamine 1-carboxyvinyltransferase
VERILIKGKKRIKGRIPISGSKNAALPIIAAALLTDKKVFIRNIPNIADVHVMIELVNCMGAKVRFQQNTLSVEAAEIAAGALAHNPLANKVRYSIHLIGALLSRFNKIQMPLPGGCKIGTRKLDSYISTLTSLGANVRIKDNNIEVQSGELHGSHIVLEYPSVSATENAIIAASLATGTSIIENSAKEPEIVDLANFLNSMGAKIRGAGAERIEVVGVDMLSGADYTIIPDRIETGTFMVAAAITKGEVSLENTTTRLMESVVSKLSETGMEIYESNGTVHAVSQDPVYPVDIVTSVYPGFSTDMQPIVTPLLAVAKGQSTIKETIYENRFNHVMELRKMGADITIKGDTLIVSGPTRLVGAEVEARDIRSGASVLLAGLAAEGKTLVRNASQIFRGYEDPITKLKSVGACLELVT